MRASRATKLLIKPLRVDSNAIATVPLTVQGVTGQTANIAEFQSSAGVVNTALDANGMLTGTRLIVNPTAKTIVDGSATALFDVACAAGAIIGGVFVFTIEVMDGTDLQALSGIVSYSAVNKAGTHTCTITQLATTEAKAVSAGTLTLAWTHVTGTNKTTVKLQPTGSLTETTYRITYTVLPCVGAVTVV